MRTASVLRGHNLEEILDGNLDPIIQALNTSVKLASCNKLNKLSFSVKMAIYMHERDQYFYVTPDGRGFPAEDLFGYADSLIKTRLSAAYALGCELISSRSRSLVLDVGSGHGHGVVKINDLLTPEFIISSDRDFSYLRCQDLVLSNGQNPYRFVRLEAPELPIATDSVDTVFLMHVLEHLDRPEDTLADIRRVLKSDGELVVATPWIKNLIARNPYDEHVYDAVELEELICETDFRVKMLYITADSRAFAFHSRKKLLARIPFARTLRGVFPLEWSEKILRSGISDQPLSINNFYITEEPNEYSIDLLAIASKR